MINILRKRRSIRKFTHQQISEQDLKVLQECLLRSPSSRNKHPWEFVFINEKKLIKQLAESKKHGSQFLENAPLAIVICGDKNITDVWVEDCSIASTIVQLTAESLGLGSCWIQIRNRLHNDNITSEEYIQKLLDIPENLKIESIIAIGHPDEEKLPVPEKELHFEKIKFNRREK